MNRKNILSTFFTLTITFTLIAQPPSFTEFIRVDQFGYFPNAKKVAVVANPKIGFNSNKVFNAGTATNDYEVRKWDTDEVVFTGTLQTWKNSEIHDQSGDQGWWFDFSEVSEEGTYYVFDKARNKGSHGFKISNDVYKDVLKTAIRTYYYQRCNFAKEEPYAEGWTDAAAYEGNNQDRFATSRFDKGNPATQKDVHGGWFDAGDINKYTTFTYDPMMQLLEAYRMIPDVFEDNYNIPESGNGIPDLLDELKWELDWLKRMQDASETNGFFLKVGVDNHDGQGVSSTDRRPRYYLPECTSSTIVGTAIFALAAQVYEDIDADYASDLLDRAEKAWERAKVTTNNFTSFETQCDDQNITSGDADLDEQDQIERVVVAAIYLYEATGKTVYKTYAESNYQNARPFNEFYWSPYRMPNAYALLLFSELPNVSSDVANKIRNQKASQNYVFSLNQYNDGADLYRAYMEDWAHHWGSNMIRSNSGNINLDFVQFDLNSSDKQGYIELAQQYLHWLNGVNPLGKVMLSNMYDYGAEDCINEIYHTWFDDGTVYDNALTSPIGPPPAYLVGGPNKNFSIAEIVPPSQQPVQKSYKDWNANWPENSWEISEPAIYYQGAYISLLARLIGLNKAATSTSTKEIRLAGVRVFPNPASAQIRVEWTKPLSKHSSFKLLDLNGRALRQGVLEQSSPGHLFIDLNNLTDGIYFVELRSGERLFREKVIVAK